jgi:hypothetical protein
MSAIININWTYIPRRSILHLSPLFSSKEIDLARSRSGLFFYFGVGTDTALVIVEVLKIG